MPSKWEKVSDDTINSVKLGDLLMWEDKITKLTAVYMVIKQYIHGNFEMWDLIVLSDNIEDTLIGKYIKGYNITWFKDGEEDDEYDIYTLSLTT